MIEGEILVQGIILFLVLSYYFNLVSLVEQGFYHLVDLVDQFGLPSMLKREIVENGLKLIKEGYCKGRLLRTYKYDQYASIIIFSLMSNLLVAGKIIAYMI